MAKIVLSDEAPQGEAVTFSLGNAEPFQAPHETDDQVLIASAAVHPWLEVERDAEEEFAVEAPEQHIKPADDALSAQNSVAFDPDEVAKAREEAAEVNPVAIDAGLDQSEPVETGGVAETLAADDDEEDFS